MAYSTAAAAHLAPTDGNVQRLSAAGTNESVSTQLDMGCYYSLKVGDAAVRVRFCSVSYASMVGATDIKLQAGDTYHWIVERGSLFVACESADGAATHEVWVWKSSPKV